MPESLERFLLFALGGGLATFIWTATKSYIAYKDSAEMRETNAIKNLEKWREDADKRAETTLKSLDYERRISDYWRMRAATLEHRLRLNGVDVPTMKPFPVPPKVVFEEAENMNTLNREEKEGE